MNRDPIIEEVRRHRDAHASKFNYDLKKICKDLKEKEKDYGDRVVSLPPKYHLKENRETLNRDSQISEQTG